MANVINILLLQGSTFVQEVIAKDTDNTVINLSGYSVASKMKKTHTTPASGAITFSCGIYEAITGKIRLNLTASQTAAIVAGRYVYDVEITAPGTESTVYSATVTDGGSGYTTATITFSGGGASIQATGTATIASGIITGITVTSAGTGYVSDPFITITGDGAGATATAIRGGFVTRVVEGMITVSPEITI